MAKKKSGKKTVKILGAIVVALILFVIIGKKAGWIGGENATEVTLAKAEKREITEKVSASGKVYPEFEVKLSPDVPGEIVDLYVKDGDSVAKGQLLLKIRPDNFQSALERTMASLNNSKAMLSQSSAGFAQSKARFARAEADFKRNKQLYQEKVISDAEFEQAKANYEVARQELEAARQSVAAAQYNIQSASATVKEANENLRRTSIFAPENGIISMLNVEKGERVVGTSQMAGTELLRIADLNSMEVRVDVNENDVVRVSLGDTAEIEVDAYPDRKFKGIVTSIANSAKQAVTADAVTEFEVRIKILPESYKNLVSNKEKYPFRPGMTASVEIITEKKTDVLAIPLSSVTVKSDKESGKPGERAKGKEDTNSDKPAKKEILEEIVYVYDSAKGTVKQAKVKTGISDFDYIEIKSGLKSGAVVVSGPYMVVSKKLRDGVKVKEKKEANSSREKGEKGK